MECQKESAEKQDQKVRGLVGKQDQKVRGLAEVLNQEAIQAVEVARPVEETAL